MIGRRAAARVVLSCVISVLAMPAAAIADSASGTGPDASEVTATSATSELGSDQSRSALWGVYIPGAPQDAQVLNDFQSMIGSAPDIVDWYQPWVSGTGAQDDATLPDLEALERVSAQGATPMITWEAWGTIDGHSPAQLATIPTGAFDGYIDQWATILGAFGKPVFLRPFHEMNNLEYPWAVGASANSAADLIRAWQYIHDRFSRLGADNVMWVWCPNTENDRVPFGQIYPGNEYVDWLGVDGFNGGSQLDWGGWLTPQELFRRSYSSLTALSSTKPIMIGETSSVEQGGDRAQWIADLYHRLPEVYPRLRAILWFQADTTNRGEADWRVQTSAASVSAFRAAISH